MQSCILAVDIGASSGRHIVGTVQKGKLVLREVYRFENGVHRQNGHLCWDIEALAREVLNGLKAAHDAGYTPATVGIDTWAVDFVLLDKNGKRLGDAVAYRDERTEGVRDALAAAGLPFAEHYARTGIQYQPFNTAYQLAALKTEHPEQLANAETFLMIPDYLNYLLCGVAANEYTNASTTALVGANIKDWDNELIEKLGLPRGIFQPIKTAGTVLGHLTPEVQAKVGFDAEVILPATHDTSGQLFRVLFFERHQLVDCVELLVLDAGAGVMLGKGQTVVTLQRLAHALGALIAVSHGIADTLAVSVQQHKVHGPGINADGRGCVPGIVGGFQAVHHFCRQGVNIPAEVAVYAADAVLKPVDLLQADFAVLHGADNVPPTGRTYVNC